MGLILDSTVVIAAERRKFDLDRFLLADAAAEAVFLSVITASELLHGVERAADEIRRRSRGAFVEAVLDAIPVLPFDLSCARRHAAVWAGLESAGRRIGAHDMLIAATCLRYGHRLATLNTDEFNRVAGLELADVRPFAA